jgi:hypothetical protein
MIQKDPHDRISIDSALNHWWIINDILPSEEAAEIIKRTRRQKKELSRTIYTSDAKSGTRKLLWDKYFNEKRKDTNGNILC